MTLDRLIALKFGYTRSYAINLIRQGFVLVNGKIIKKRNIIVEFNANIDIHIPKHFPKILWFNQDICVIYKPIDLCVERSLSTPKWYSVLTELLCEMLNVQQVFLLHRLDKDTQGIMCVALNESAYVFYKKRMQNGEFCKAYKAFDVPVDYSLQNLNVFTCPHGRFTIKYGDGNCLCNNAYEINTFYIDENAKGVKLGSTKKCVTKINKIDNGYDCILVTGRTHQIRLMMLSFDTPIYGDSIYGVKADYMRLFSYYLSFVLD